MRRLSLLTSLLLAASILTAASPATHAKQIHVTFIGDSIPAALDYVGSAREQLSRGLVVRFDLRVCRRVATPSCPYMGSAPPSVLASVRAARPGLGDVLVVDVGYNERSHTYQEGMRQVIRAALAAGVKGIVWVTLRETLDIYSSTNVAIRSEAKRWPQVQVADWESYSSGRPWFRDDGLHLNSAGAEGLAALIRPLVLRAARGSCAGKGAASTAGAKACKP